MPFRPLMGKKLVRKRINFYVKTVGAQSASNNPCSAFHPSTFCLQPVFAKDSVTLLLA